MNTKAVIGLIALVVIIGVGAWYSSSKPSQTSGTETEMGTGTDQGNAGSSTFAALVAQGGSRTCTVSVDNQGTKADGTVYIADGRMRGDFTTTTNGQAMTAHMIQADGYIYSWTDAVPQGVKVSLAAAQTSSTQNRGIDPNANVTYDCSSWSADESKFSTPESVTFMDLNAMGPGMAR